MDIDRAIEFIIEQQAKFSADIDVLKGTVSTQAEAIKDLKEIAIAHSESIAGTSQNLIQLAQVVSSLADSVGKLESEAEINRLELREAIDNLITSDENLRSFAIDIARMVKQHDARISQLEKRE